MPKETKNKKEELQVPVITIGGKNSLTGKTISINLKKLAFFGVGPIWLTSTKYWCTIPDNMSNKDYELINKAIKEGQVVLGKKFIPPVDKIESVIDEYWLEIKASGVGRKTKEKLRKLLKLGSDGFFTPIEILNACIAKEQAYKNRNDVIALLKEAMNNYDGPVQLYDPPEEEEGIRKVLIKDGAIIGVDAKGNEQDISRKPPPKSDPAVKAALDNLIN